MIWTPYQIAQAGMIGTEQVVDRLLRRPIAARCWSFLSRADVASQLQSLGIDAGDARRSASPR